MNFLITNLGSEDAVLSMTWLQRHNPNINWEQKCLSFTTGEQITATASSQNVAMQSRVRTKTTSPETPLPHESIDNHIPNDLLEFRTIFDKQTSERLPERRPWDHVIDLKEGAEPKTCKVYPLTQTEQAELDKFIKEHLAKGYIRPSKSPMASPFFFVKKKEGTLRPVQDYRYLNSITIKNQYPLPLIPDYSINSEGLASFPKWTSDGVTITSVSKRVTNGRRHSRLTRGCLNRLSRLAPFSFSFPLFSFICSRLFPFLA